jgi:hypothetical protein
MCTYTESFFNFIDQFTALHFTVIGVSLAIRHLTNFADELACLMDKNV